jgi:hypothetical protein
MNQAAQAARGGAGQLTNKSPEQALWELALGGASVTLAAVDVGLGAQQMEQDYAGQVFRGEKKKTQTSEQKTAKKTAQTAQVVEPNGLFDGHYAEDYYKTLWKQGNTEHNVFKLFGGTVGGSIAAGYNGVTGLADKGAAGSANLFVEGEQEGGVGGVAKQLAGGAAGMVFSLATEDTLPQSSLTLSTMGLGGAAQAGKLGVFSKPILRTMQVGGAFGSGTSIGQGISGKNMFTGEDLSPGQRMFDLSFGAAGAGLDLGGAGLQLGNLSKGFPTLTNGLTNQSKVNIFNRLNNGWTNETGAIRLGEGTPSKTPSNEIIEVRSKETGQVTRVEPKGSYVRNERAGNWWSNKLNNLKSQVQAKYGVPASQNTISIAETDIPGLKQGGYEGYSREITRAIREKQGLSATPGDPYNIGADPNRRIKAPVDESNPKNLRFTNHAEEGSLNSIDKDIQAKLKSGELKAADLKDRTVKLEVDHFDGSCKRCVQGLSSDKRPGIIKQFSDLYPEMNLEVIESGKGTAFRVKGGEKIATGNILNDGTIEWTNIPKSKK